MPKQYLHLSPNERLRGRLDDFYTCLKDCLQSYQVKEAFEEVCDAICKEADELLEELSILEEKYQEELPLESEEHKGVEWPDERILLLDYRESFCSHEYADGCKYIEYLVGKLNDIADIMDRIDGQLYPEDDTEIYISYCKRELNSYAMGGWNRAFRELKNTIAKAPQNRRTKLYEEKLKKVFCEIQQSSEYIFNEEKCTIFYEALGRHLWNIRHDERGGQNIEDVLRKIKTAEFYSNKLQRKFLFLDGEPLPDDELDRKARQALALEEAKQHGVQLIAFRLGKCKEYFAKGFSESFATDMLEELLKSEHSALVADKMSKRKIFKFIHQLAGVLKANDIFENCSNADLVEALEFTKPQKESRKDYIRHMIDDVPEIQTWIENYIKDYRQKLREQPEVGVNC